MLWGYIPLYMSLSLFDENVTFQPAALQFLEAYTVVPDMWVHNLGWVTITRYYNVCCGAMYLYVPIPIIYPNYFTYFYVFPLGVPTCP